MLAFQWWLIGLIGNLLVSMRQQQKNANHPLGPKNPDSLSSIEFAYSIAYALVLYKNTVQREV